MSSSLQESSSTKALLGLYIDGKEITENDVSSCIKSLQDITDVSMLVEEVYLLSIYHYLSPLEDLSGIRVALSDIEGKMDVSSLQGALFYNKFLLAEVLCGQNKLHSTLSSSYALIENLASLDDLATFGVIAFFIGLFREDSLSMEEASKIAELILKFTNDSGEVEVLFMHAKGAYESDKTRVSIFVLLSLYQSILNKKELQSMLNTFDPFEGGLFGAVDVEKKMLCRLFSESEKLKRKFGNKERGDFSLDGLLKQKTNGFSYTSSTGSKVGMGNISYKEKIVVPSFGPHVLPLGKNDYYGLSEQICDTGENISGNIVMWNRVKSKDPYGNHWIHSKVSASESNLKIESFVWSKGQEEKLCMVFFIRGKSLEINDKTYLSGGLERVHTATSKVEVDLNGKTLQIHTKKSVSIEVIPLAGQEFFWGSDFIIAYPFEERQMLSFDFVMD